MYSTLLKSNFIFLSLLVILSLSSGCSATWDGFKDDSGNLWDATKDAVDRVGE